MIEDGRTEGLARRLYTAWNGRKLDALEAIVDGPFILVSKECSAVRTPEELQDTWSRAFQAIPDSRIEIRDVYSSGSVVVVESTMYAQTPSAGQLSVDICDALQFSKGRLASVRVYKQFQRPDLSRILAALVSRSAGARPVDPATVTAGPRPTLEEDRSSESDGPLADHDVTSLRPPEPRPGTDDDVGLAVELFETRNARDIDAVLDHVADRAFSICQKGDVLDSPGDFRRNLEVLYATWPDGRWTERSIFASHGTVVMEATVGGTHRKLLGYREADLIELTRFQDGKLVWARSYTAGLSEALAPLPSIFDDWVPSSATVEPVVIASNAPLDVTVPG